MERARREQMATICVAAQAAAQARAEGPEIDNTLPIIDVLRPRFDFQAGKSGLGIEAQREALERFATSEGFQLGSVFVEVETGKGSDALERRRSLPPHSMTPGDSGARWPSSSSIA
jgi:hypothetical protein